MIYFIECSGRIKVGFSNNPWHRMGKISADSPFPCTLIGVMTGDRTKEALIHAQWRHLHCHREWFAASKDFLAWIADNAAERPAAAKEKSKGEMCGLRRVLEDEHDVPREHYHALPFRLPNPSPRPHAVGGRSMTTLREAALSFMDLFVVDNGDDRGLSIDGIDMVEMTHRFDELQSAMKAEIPPDIMQKAEEAYTASLHDSMAGKPDYLKHVAGAIQEARDGWEPIETAPKDGTDVLVALHLWNDPTKPHTFEVVAWNGGEWASDSYPVYPPTHWRPLPKPPVSSATVEGATHD